MADMDTCVRCNVPVAEHSWDDYDESCFIFLRERIERLEERLRSVEELLVIEDLKADVEVDDWPDSQDCAMEGSITPRVR